MTDKEKTREYFFKLLSKKAYSYEEMKEKLRKKGFSENIINTTLQYGKDMGYLNDRKFAEEIVNLRLKKGEGARKIAFELRKKKIDDEIIKEVLRTIDEENEKSNIERILCKLKEERKSNPQKLIGYLLRRGFSYSSIRDVLSSKFGAENINSEVV